MCDQGRERFDEYSTKKIQDPQNTPKKLPFHPCCCFSLVFLPQVAHLTRCPCGTLVWVPDRDAELYFPFVTSHNENHHKHATQNNTSPPPTSSLPPFVVEQTCLFLPSHERKTMDVTFVLEESGVTATVEVPCEADAAAAKEVACTALAVSPASVEMRIGTQVLEGTCRLQDTAFGAGVQVVLARRFADIKCPAEYNFERSSNNPMISLSRCGTLCIYVCDTNVVGFDTETFASVFEFSIPHIVSRWPAAISQCKTRCYLACEEGLLEVALPGGEVLREVDGSPYAVFACGSVVVSRSLDGISVYDEDLTLLRFLSYEGCYEVELSDCGGWVIAHSNKEKNVRLWDVNTGEDVACVPLEEAWAVTISRSASVFAVEVEVGQCVCLFDWSGAALGSIDVEEYVDAMLRVDVSDPSVHAIQSTHTSSPPNRAGTRRRQNNGCDLCAGRVRRDCDSGGAVRGGRCSGKGGCVHGACCLACVCRDAHRHAGAGGDVPSAGHCV